MVMAYRSNCHPGITPPALPTGGIAPRLESLTKPARRMLDELTARINRFANLSFELATMKLDVRLRRTIRDLARQTDQWYDGGIIRPAPTHAELAAMLGTTREVVSRSMVTLTRVGAITTGRQQIQIRSIELLRDDNETVVVM